MTYMGENEHFEDDYYGGASGGLEEDISGAVGGVEEADPFAALDDFASVGKSEALIDEKEPIAEDELAVVLDDSGLAPLDAIEEAVDAESASKKSAAALLAGKALKKKPSAKKAKKSTAKKTKKKPVKKSGATKKKKRK